MLTWFDIILVVMTIFILLYLYFTRNFNHWKEKNVPYIKPLPFFGNIFDGILMRQSTGEIFYDLYYKTLDPLVGAFILDKPCLLIKDPTIIKKVLINDFQYFYDRNVFSNKRDDPVSAHALFMLKNPDWKEVRAKISPVFTSSKMKIMSQLIEEAAHKMISYLELQASKNLIEIKDVCMKFSVDVITSTAFGINANSFDHYSQFRTKAQRLTDWDNIGVAFRFRCYFLAHGIVKLFRIKMFDPEVIRFLKESFFDVMNNRAISKNSRNDLIDILLDMKNDDKNFMDGDVLLSQAVQFFLAGYETSSSAMSFALYEMARNPEIQRELRNEINEISNKHGGINYDSIKEMEYLEMCVKEVLRKYPVLSFLDRQCNSNYTIPENGAVIDKGTPIFISILGLHYDPKYFPSPDVFDPRRFSKENKQKIDNFTYMPFGEGPRNCIGARFGMLTVKMGLAHILKNFEVYGLETGEKLKFNPNGLFLSPLTAMNLKLKKI